VNELFDQPPDSQIRYEQPDKNDGDRTSPAPGAVFGQMLIGLCAEVHQDVRRDKLSNMRKKFPSCASRRRKIVSTSARDKISLPKQGNSRLTACSRNMAGIIHADTGVGRWS